MGADVPDHGFVEQCNMSGQYVTFVIYGIPSTDLTLCNVGVIGNSLIRDTALETTVEIPAGETHTM